MTVSGTEETNMEEAACSNYINRSTPMPRAARMSSAGVAAILAH